jgi:serine/threonine-protein kinase
MGTLTYSSPEQLRSPKDVTPRSDVFSLGAMLYEIATGHLAFPGDNDYDVMDAIIKGRYVPPEEHHPAIDPVIAAVIRKALELDPAKRFASCKQMADALTVPAAIEATPPPASASPAAASPAPPPARPSLSALDSAPAPPRDTLPGSRRPGVWLGLAAVVLVGGGVAMFAARGGGTRAVADNPRDAGVCAGDAAICTSPPAATCATPTTLRTFAAAGTCTAAKGGCSYDAVDTVCGAGCSSGACNSDSSSTASAAEMVQQAEPSANVEPAQPAAAPGDELIGNYTCQVSCTNVGSQRCSASAYGCAIARDAKGTLRLRKFCCSFAWNLAISKITDESFVVTGDVCFGNGPCGTRSDRRRRMSGSA